MPTSTDKNISNPIFNVLTRSIYDSITPNADEFYLITDDAPITAGTGLTASMSGGSVVIDHTNTISAQTIQAVYPITFDSEGHITSAGSAIDLSEVGGSGGGAFILSAEGALGNSLIFNHTGAELNQAYNEGQNIILKRPFSDGSAILYTLESVAYDSSNNRTYMFERRTEYD